MEKLDSTTKRGTVLLAGTFNPFTIGHADLADRALKMFSGVVIGVGVNFQKGEDAESMRLKTEDADRRVEEIRKVYRNTPKVRVERFNGLTVDFAKDCGCIALLRGVRDVKDFEYEKSIADANRALAGMETILLFSRPELSFISSSLLRELKSHGKDISPFLPPIHNQEP